MYEKNWSEISIKGVYPKPKLLKSVKDITSKVLDLHMIDETECCVS
jgi:hypothetical protein